MAEPEIEGLLGRVALPSLSGARFGGFTQMSPARTHSKGLASAACGGQDASLSFS